MYFTIHPKEIFLRNDTACFPKELVSTFPKLSLQRTEHNNIKTLV
jgi:hypothetical protein